MAAAAAPQATSAPPNPASDPSGAMPLQVRRCTRSSLGGAGAGASLPCACGGAVDRTTSSLLRPEGAGGGVVRRPQPSLGAPRSQIVRITGASFELDKAALDRIVKQVRQRGSKAPFRDRRRPRTFPP